MIKVRNMTVAYGGAPIFTDLSITFEPGKITGIIGPNGAGKSTMIKGILGLIHKQSGQVTLHDKPVSKQLKNIAYVEQRAALDLTFPINVFDTVLTGTYPNLGLFNVPGAKEKSASQQALADVNLSEFSQRQIGELSGGQLQRVFVARAIVQQADVIILDEPFVGIDMKSEAEIMSILKRWQEEGKTIIVVHHDLNKVTKYFDNLVIINRGVVASGTTSEVFTKENITTAFSIGLFIDGLMQYNFLQTALITSILVGIMSGIIGSFIILRGMSLMGDAISHAVLPGVAVAYMLGINILFGASVFGILAALLIGLVASKSKLKNDTAIGIVFSAFFALGFILISLAESATNLHHILFGNVLAVSDNDLVTTAIVLAIVLIFVVVFYKELLITSFDNTFAQAYGLKTQLMHYALMLVLTLVTVTALQTVGIILIVAMLITPAATAYLLTNRLSHMMIVAALFSVISSVIGLYMSYTFNWASGPAIVLTAAVFFSLAFLFSPKQGIIFKKKIK